MAFLVDAPDAAAGEPAAAPHPLAPLTAAEIETASAAVKATQKLNAETARFVYISLYEPAKHDVIAFDERRHVEPPTGSPRSCCASGRTAPPTRRSFGCRRAGGRAAGAADGAEVIDFKRVPGVQPSVMLEEFLAAEDIVRRTRAGRRPCASAASRTSTCA